MGLQMMPPMAVYIPQRLYHKSNVIMEAEGSSGMALLPTNDTSGPIWF
jgi:hypothetical protein